MRLILLLEDDDIILTQTVRLGHPGNGYQYFTGEFGGTGSDKGVISLILSGGSYMWATGAQRDAIAHAVKIDETPKEG